MAAQKHPLISFVGPSDMNTDRNVVSKSWEIIILLYFLLDRFHMKQYVLHGPFLISQKDKSEEVQKSGNAIL